MKKIIPLIIALAAMMPTTLSAQEFYIVRSKQDNNIVFTYYYDYQKSARSNGNPSNGKMPRGIYIKDGRKIVVK